LKRITVTEDLSNICRLTKLAFDFIWGNVLTLSQLEYVFLSVNDLKGAIRKEHTDVASVYPAILIDSLPSLVGLTEISLEVIVTLVANLTSRERIASLRVLILACIVHLRNIDKFNVKATVRAADMTRCRILLPSDSGWCTTLGLAISFKNLAAKSDLEEFKHFS